MTKKQTLVSLMFLLGLPLFSGCAGMGEGLFFPAWPGSSVADASPSSNKSNSGIQLTSWVPQLWSSGDGSQNQGLLAAPLAPLKAGVNTLKSGVGQLHEGTKNIWSNTVAGGTGLWEGTKRLLIPPIFTADNSGATNPWARTAQTTAPPVETTRQFFSQDRPKWK